MKRLSPRAEKALIEYVRLHLTGESKDLHRIRSCGLKTAKEIYRYCGAEFPKEINNPGKWSHPAKKFWKFSRHPWHDFSIKNFSRT